MPLSKLGLSMALLAMGPIALAGEPMPGKICHLVPPDAVADGQVGILSCAQALHEDPQLPSLVSNGEDVLVQYDSGPDPLVMPYPQCNTGRDRDFHARLASNKRDLGLWYPRRQFACAD